LARGKAAEVPGDEVVLELAQWAGTTVATAAVTDAWESVRSRVAKLLGRGDSRRTEIAEGWLDKTREQLAAAGPGAELEQAQSTTADRWSGRFADLMEEDLSLEPALRALIEEVTSQLPAAQALALAMDHSVAAGRDVKVTATGGSVAAGVIHGGVALPGAAPSSQARF
jgi:hypothetical protein